MISGVLSDAVAAIDEYLQADECKEVYRGTLRERIIRLRGEMDEIRAILDVPPAVAENSAGRASLANLSHRRKSSRIE